MLTGIELIAFERERQIKIEGWNSTHDSGHDFGELTSAAICYAGSAIDIAVRQVVYITDHRNKSVIDYAGLWPWDREWDKRNKHGKKRKLIIAGALIAAEIDRLQRKEACT